MNKNAFDFIRNSLNRIADGIASSDGRYPVWDYKSLLELINTLEEEYKKNDGASARSSLQQTCNNLATDTISREAAIDALDVLCQEHRYKIPGKIETYSQYNEAWQDALDRAEGAIFNLPSAQPKERTEERTETHACDCIDRQAAIDALSQYPFEKVVNCISIIEELPSAQSEEVIPHRNYKYLSDYWCECGWHLGKKGEVKYCSECGRRVNWDG